MGIAVVWKLGTPSRRLVVHAFEEPGTAGTGAICSGRVFADGVPIVKVEKAPKCKVCVGRLGLMEKHGLTELRKNFAGLIRSQRLADERKTHWWVERHGGRRKDRWRRMKHAPQERALVLYREEKSRLSVVLKGFRRRGGVRLVDPTGRIECEFIKSPWLKKEIEDAHGNAAVPVRAEDHGPQAG